MSPIFYPLSALPESLRPLMYLNPLTFGVEQVRRVTVWGQQPEWPGLTLYIAIGLLVAWGGLAFFQKSRRGFADVL